MKGLPAAVRRLGRLSLCEGGQIQLTGFLGHTPAFLVGFIGYGLSWLHTPSPSRLGLDALASQVLGRPAELNPTKPTARQDLENGGNAGRANQ